ncbi:hypothetical protein FOZ60_007794 [Perkinsus olseni]|uniref:Uncharacterized protein n=1 Tax=Perkinsus olseni TaxID=32597 RepID=A0A7J6PEM1_PEROL|nr:hypothetical protein FOZ60_007794 [Perkinsus olseni]
MVLKYRCACELATMVQIILFMGLIPTCRAPSQSQFTLLGLIHILVASKILSLWSCNGPGRPLGRQRHVPLMVSIARDLKLQTTFEVVVDLRL